ncbi:MAG: efflux RND transporter permease subunit [Myxococcota bacterium]|nr:efflux RND transporter permease subunit [Myxococcota bacterium]
MSKVITWFIQNPVASNLLMMILVVGGLMALPGIRQEEFPTVDVDLVRVSVEYPGASPGEIEESICIRIEEEVESVPDIDRLNSIAVEGACIVSIEIVIGSDIDEALIEIQNRVDAIDTFPIDAEKPIISKILIRQPVLQISFSGNTEEMTLKRLGERSRNELALLPGVSQVTLDYARPFEISVEVSEETLRRHGLTLQDVAGAIRASSLDLPGGSVKTQAGEILLRSVGQAYRGEQFADIIVIAHSDGTNVRLGDIATVVDGFKDIDLRAQIDGMPAVILNIERVGDEDTLEIADQVRTWFKGAEPRLPEGIEMKLLNDQSADLVVRLNALLVNARSGLILVAAVLALFLRFRLAMWVTAGVPISFLGALMLFPTFAISISTLTVMSFILVLGILVDDAIVIGESVHRREAKGESQIDAARNGTLDVYIPVTFGVLTSVAAFLPLALLPGHMGRFFGVIGVTSIICLGFSLIESQLILPGHLAHRRTSSKSGTPNSAVRFWNSFQTKVAKRFETFSSVNYGEALRKSIEWRYTTASVAIGIVVLTVALISSGRMRYQFFPAVEGDAVYAALTMPQGIPLKRTEEAVAQILEGAKLVAEELKVESGGRDIVLFTVSSIGKQFARNGPPDISVKSGGAHLAEVSLQLVPATDRDIDASYIANLLRERVGPIPDAVDLAYISDAFSAGEPIDIQLMGSNIEALTQAAASVRQRLSQYRGMSDISDSFRSGKQEVSLRLLPEARPLGLNQLDLARQVRQAFYGEEAQRIQRGKDDVRVMVRYPMDERRSLGALEEMRIRTPDGTEVPFAAVADARLGRGFATIRRSDRRRVVNVTGEVDRSISTPERVLGDLQKDMLEIIEAYPGIEYEFGGEQREQQETGSGLIRGFALALMMIYCLLAIPLKSYLQPLIIMSVIPFGAVGAILGHLVMGWDIVFFSVLGIVALSGVVVNASLVLVHSVNSRRNEGSDLHEAIFIAGTTRFRPIVLTSLTTFLGLVPLMFEPSVPARPLVPMAIALGYGVLFASAVTLFLVPSAYVILDDLTKVARRLKRSRTRTKPRPESFPQIS